MTTSGSKSAKYAESRPSRVPLEPEALVSITSETERVLWGAQSQTGLTRRAEGDVREVDVPIVVLVTDRRVLFVAADEENRDGEVDAGALAYDELAAVNGDGEELSLSTTDALKWSVELPADAPGDPGAVVRHLRWVGDLRARLIFRAADVGQASAEIEKFAAEGDWEPARQLYRDNRDALDVLIGEVQRAGPIDDSDLAPRLTELERNLEAAYANALLERAESSLALAQGLIESGVYDRARIFLESARADYDDARGHATAVERADAFQFGQQRTVHERIERLGWEIETVEAAPLRRAYEAKVDALSAEDATDKVESLERAFRRFGRILVALTREDVPVFGGDPVDVRQEVFGVAGRLVAVRRTLARVAWDEGAAGADGDDGHPAVRRLDAAIEHAERAVELADQFRPDAADDTRNLLEEMRASRERFSETGDAAHVLRTEELVTDDATADESGTGSRRSRSDRDGRALTNGRRRRELLAGDDYGDGDDGSP